MVFLSCALFPHLTVADNIVFGLRSRRVPRVERRRRLDHAARLVGLDELLECKPAQLSGDQRQRVALARAVIAEHPICLMDEPLSNLDARLRAEMRSEIRDLQRRLGMTAIYWLVSVSHHWNNFLWPLIVTNSVETRALTVGLAIVSAPETGVNWATISAATLLSVGPLLVAVVLLQRQFVQPLLRAGLR